MVNLLPYDRLEKVTSILSAMGDMDRTFENYKECPGECHWPKLHRAKATFLATQTVGSVMVHLVHMPNWTRSGENVIIPEAPRMAVQSV